MELRIRIIEPHYSNTTIPQVIGRTHRMEQDNERPPEDQDKKSRDTECQTNNTILCEEYFTKMDYGNFKSTFCHIHPIVHDDYVFGSVCKNVSDIGEYVGNLDDDKYDEMLERIFNDNGYILTNKFVLFVSIETHSKFCSRLETETYFDGTIYVRMIKYNYVYKMFCQHKNMINEFVDLLEHNLQMDEYLERYGDKLMKIILENCNRKIFENMIKRIYIGSDWRFRFHNCINYYLEHPYLDDSFINNKELMHNFMWFCKDTCQFASVANIVNFLFKLMRNNKFDYQIHQDFGTILIKVINIWHWSSGGDLGTKMNILMDFYIKTITGERIVDDYDGEVLPTCDDYHMFEDLLLCIISRYVIVKFNEKLLMKCDEMVKKYLLNKQLVEQYESFYRK